MRSWFSFGPSSDLCQSHSPYRTCGDMPFCAERHHSDLAHTLSYGQCLPDVRPLAIMLLGFGILHHYANRNFLLASRLNEAFLMRCDPGYHFGCSRHGLRIGWSPNVPTLRKRFTLVLCIACSGVRTACSIPHYFEVGTQPLSPTSQIF